MTWKIKQGDWIEVLRNMPDESVQCVVTSPPYWGLRDYGVSGQLGLERTPEEYVAKMVEGFREVRRVLRSDGTLWLNLGDSYAGSWGAQSRGNSTGEGRSTLEGSSPLSARQIAAHPQFDGHTGSRAIGNGVKPKDLIGVPWAVAFALRADGWYLRQDIIWAKPNPMPESVTDRCTKSHEYIFLLTKSARYFYDQEAVKEPATQESIERRGREDFREKDGWDEAYMGNPPRGLAGNGRGGRNAFRGQGSNRDSETGPANRDGREMRDIGADGTRNKRDVWNISTQPFPEAHFATFPPEIPEICILAGSREGDTVLDPFNGAGTTGLVATRLHRNYIGIELNPEYVEMAECRIINDAPLFNSDRG